MIIHFEDLHQHVQFRIAKAHGVQNPIDFKSFFKLNPIIFTEDSLSKLDLQNVLK